MRVRIARLVPGLLTSWAQRSCFFSPSGLALAARATTSLANVKVLGAHSEPQVPPGLNVNALMAGGLLMAVLTSNEGSAECMPAKRKAPAAPKPAAAKKKDLPPSDGRRCRQRN